MSEAKAGAVLAILALSAYFNWSLWDANKELRVLARETCDTNKYAHITECTRYFLNAE